jgi:hypothetical protein
MLPLNQLAHFLLAAQDLPLSQNLIILFWT